MTDQNHDYSDLAKESLCWITCAFRQLEVQELSHALAVRRPGCTYIDEESLVDPEDILSSSHGLITIDEQSQVIRLVHSTT